MVYKKNLYQQILPLREVEEPNFSNYYVCEANRLAYESLINIDILKTKRILIYSLNSSGKSHLLKAFNKRFIEKGSLYINLKSIKLTEFIKNKIYQSKINYLLLDQVESLKDENISFFTSLYEQCLKEEKFIIMAGKFKEVEVENLSPHIRSRLQNTLLIKIKRYREEDVKNIIRFFIKRIHLDMNERYINYILRNLPLELKILTSFLIELNTIVKIEKKLNYQLINRLIRELKR